MDTTTTFYLCAAFAFIVGLMGSRFVLPRIALVAARRRLFDSHDGRKLHKGNVPRLGGLAFFPCIAVALFMAILLYNKLTGAPMLGRILKLEVFTISSALFILFLCGLMDDLIGVSYRSKFLIQLICGILVTLSGLYFNDFYGLFGIHALPLWVGLPFTVLTVVFILNAVNLIDGIDGLASGLSGIAFLAFGLLFAYLGDRLHALLSFSALGVLIPFFHSNVFGQASRGRKLFMGDTGALTIGLLLSVLSVRLSMADPVKDARLPGSIVLAFSFLLVPMLDVIRVFIHRIRCGRSPFLPDRNHIHHKFLDMGFSHRQAMMSIVGLSLAFVVVNVVAIHFVPITALFLADVVVWTALNLYWRKKIIQHNSTLKQ